MLRLSEEAPSVPQAELFLLPKDQEMIEISDEENQEIEDGIDDDVIAIEDDDSVDEETQGSDGTDDDD